MTLVGVGKRYGWRAGWVLRDVDLALATGSLMMLSGVNGSGKSTLLRVIAGVSRPNAGVVRRSGAAGCEGQIAYVPQRFVPPATMSGRGYLRRFGRIRGLSGPDAERRAGELADRLGVRPGLDVELGKLSEGNLRKVALAQAFLVPVGLLALDEPLTALDREAVAALSGLLDEATREGAAVVVTDPDVVEAPAGADVYRLAHGRVYGGVVEGADEVVGGGLEEGEPAAEEQVVVRLRPPAGQAVEAPAALAGIAVNWVAESDGMVHVVVLPEHSDELLSLALQGGWGVVDVRRGSGICPTS